MIPKCNSLPADGILSHALRQIAPRLQPSQRTRILVIGCGVRIHFPWERTKETYRLASNVVNQAIAHEPSIDCVFAPEPFEDPALLLTFVDNELGNGVDGVVLVHASYTAGEIGSQFGRWLVDHPVPVLSWSQPDPAPGPDVGNQANSLCCQNFLLQMWRRLGVRYTWMHAPITEAAHGGLGRFARAVRARRRLLRGRLLHIGGSRVTAFYDGEADELAVMRRFGVRYDRIDLQAAFHRARDLPASEIAMLRQTLFTHERCAGVDVPNEQVDQTLRLGLIAWTLAAEQGYIGVTIKSWPELFDCYGCAADGAVSMLNDAGLCTAEEGEMPGLLSSLVLHALSDGQAVPTLMDISVLDRISNRIGLWHCGACPTRWLAKGARYRATKHSILENADKASAVGMMLEFPLAAGPGTVLRYQSPDCAECFVFEGSLHERDPMPMRGNYVDLEPMQHPADEIIATILGRGLDHHWSLGFGHAAGDVRLLNHFLGVRDIPASPVSDDPQLSRSV